MSHKDTLGCSEYTPIKQEQLRGILEMHIRMVKGIIERSKWAHPIYHYFDINAGPGIYNEIEGSPIIFLKLATSRELCLNYKAVFIESNTQSYQKLLENTKTYPNREVILGDHNVEMRHFLDKRYPSVLGILYNDPTGQRPSFDLLAEVNKYYPRLDLLIYCTATNIKREVHSGQSSSETLLDGLDKIDKKTWIVRKPMGKQQWTFLIGSNWEKYPDWKKARFYNVESEEGQEILAELNYTTREIINQKQLRFKFE